MKTFRFYRALWRLKNYYHNKGMYVSKDCHELGISPNEFAQWSGCGEAWFKAHDVPDESVDKYHKSVYLTDKGQNEIAISTWWMRLGPFLTIIAIITTYVCAR